MSLSTEDKLEQLRQMQSNIRSNFNFLEERHKDLEIRHNIVRRRQNLIMEFIGATPVDCEGNIAVNGFWNKVILCIKIWRGGK